MIELRNISKRYGEKVALQPADISFPKGKTTALIGPSGCGKSTLLRLIMGLIDPSSGEVIFEGNPVGGDAWIQARRKMGYVVQDGGLFPHLTAGQNITIMADHLGQPKGAIDSRVQELCGITLFPSDGLMRYPAELSGGQRQRVSLMRALMLKPDLLLLDEPLAALDPMVRSSLQTDLKQIFQQLNQTVIFVTHDMAEAGYLGDEIVLMSEGRIVQKGTLEDLRDRPASEFVKAFMHAQRTLVTI